MLNQMENLNKAQVLIDLATALAKKQLKHESKEKILKHVQYLLAEQLVYHAEAGTELK